MIDRQDIHELGTWAVRIVGGCLLIIVGAATLGVAIQVFQFITG